MKSLIKLGSKVIKSNFKSLTVPYKLTWSLTSRCNQRCLICGIWKRKPQEQELSLEEIRTMLKAYSKYSWIDLTGGEIFLREDINDIFDCIIDNCSELYMLHFPTNGMLTDKIVSSVARVINKSKFKIVVTVSLDGPKELHDQIRGIKGAWEKSIQTFKKLSEISGVEVYFGMTLSQFNMHELRETFEAAKEALPELSYHDFHVNFLNRSSHFFNNSDIDLPEPQEIQDVIKELQKLKGVPKNKIELVEFLYLKKISRFFKTGICPLPCASLSASMYLSASGDVYPCTIFDKSIANIRDYDYSVEKIYTASNTKVLRELIQQGKCPGCWTPCEAYQSIFSSALKLWRFL